VRSEKEKVKMEKISGVNDRRSGGVVMGGVEQELLRLVLDAAPEG
jgi:hypothetical protein